MVNDSFLGRFAERVVQFGASCRKERKEGVEFGW